MDRASRIRTTIVTAAIACGAVMLPAVALAASAAPGSLDYTSPSTFGVITSTRDGQNDQREIQFALKFYF